jgi:hypothetical protein
MGPSIMGSENEVEQSLGRPCHRQVQADSRTHLIRRPARDPARVIHNADARVLDRDI